MRVKYFKELKMYFHFIHPYQCYLKACFKIFTSRSTRLILNLWTSSTAELDPKVRHQRYQVRPGRGIQSGRPAPTPPSPHWPRPACPASPALRTSAMGTSRWGTGTSSSSVWWTWGEDLRYKYDSDIYHHLQSDRWERKV